MTTITLLQRNPLEALSMNPQPQRRRSKRLAAYDEEDGDFKFTRGSKRAKTEGVPAESVSVPAANPPRAKPGKAKQDAAPQASKKENRRKMSFTTPKDDDKQAHQKQAVRRSTRRSHEKTQNRAAAQSQGMEESGEVVDSSTNRSRLSDLNSAEVGEGTKITLPFSDTPVITRNRELRKTNGGRRRSSLGLRGRRASSLIDSGQSALPHYEVETAHFYKHIEAEGLSEPRRMKQLLTWCGERALDPKPAHNSKDNAALLSARLVQEAILKDFSSRSDMSDWFSREDVVKAPVVRKPNPLNAEVEVRIQKTEANIHRLKAERAEWKAIMKEHAPLSPLFDPARPPDVSDINQSLLDDEDAAILASLGSMPSTALKGSIETRLLNLQQGLEFRVDQFADGIHHIDQARQTMEATANGILARASTRLTERDRAEKEAIGTRDMPIQKVLQSLSRIIPDGQGT